jgi:hypothetical protein
MPLEKHDATIAIQAETAKQEWHAPVVTRLETGEADASDGVGHDSSGFLS